MSRVGGITKADVSDSSVGVFGNHLNNYPVFARHIAVLNDPGV